MTDKDAAAVLSYVRRLVKGRMRVEDISYRQLAAISEVSAATVCRFLSGKSCDAITFLKFTDWLKGKP